MKPGLKFRIEAQDGEARAGVITTRRGEIETPVFMPVGTAGTVKGIRFEEGGFSRLKVQYLTQVGVRPPKFVVFTSGGKPGLHFSYERYLLNRLREEFDFFATPLQIIEKHKSKNRRNRD